MGTFNIGDEVPPPSGNSWKPEVGHSITGEIVHVSTKIGKDFDGKVDQRQVRIDLKQDFDGSIVTVWAVLCTDLTRDANGEVVGYPDRLSRAISKAVIDATGAGDIKYPGSRLTVQRLPDVPPSRQGLNPAKDFAASYMPPNKSVDLGVGVDPALAQPPQQPAGGFQPVPVPQPPAQVPAAQPAAQVPPVQHPGMAQPNQGSFAQPQMVPAQPQVQSPTPSLAEQLGVPQTVLDAMTPEQIAQLQAQQVQQAPPGGLVQPPAQ